MAKEKTEPKADILDWLAELDDGRVQAQATDQLMEVVKASVATQKVGSFTITISVEPKGRQVLLVGKVGVKVPQPQMDASIFFACEDGSLARSDPRQLPLKNVIPEAPALRTVAIGSTPQSTKEE